ncbi:WbqC family protein, partial [Flavobacterium sp.]|uniref:WbqC family protein n=1 Tax=Flavobacterium sp. TaxID=239 RepID=UPI0032645C71
QPYFMPYIGYIQLLKAVDTFVVYDDVSYIKKGWINRNNILINGESFLFTIPLNEASQNKNINQIYIDEQANWKINFLKTITQSYKNAPYFQEVFSLIEEIIYQEEHNLAKNIKYSLDKICTYLSIQTKILFSSDIDKNNDLKGQDKIIEICKKLQATNYINAIGGKELYNKEAFLNNDIELNFIRTNPIIYKQFKNDFIPWLSIIDVMMFNSVEQINGFLNQYELL